ncbi:MAG: nucleoside-diphosphate sugar epimerase/dehydratase [Candidatus Omnitrophica bacterium]|nr:nucleoside-diphosphate sugar epimerase/dehydratase [Candidatus Omnitrophota bacterium]
MLRFDFVLPDEYSKVFLRTLPFLIIVKLSVFYYFGLFRGLWRYASIGDLWQIMKANAIATIGFVLCNVVTYDLYKIPRFIFLNDFILCTFLVGGIRFLTRIVRERYRKVLPTKDRTRVLVVGAGEAGVLLLKEYRNNPAMGEIVGFIDDDRVKHNESIQGVRILGGKEVIAKAVETYGIGEIVLAIPSAKGEVIRDLISHCEIPNVRLKIIPGMAKILSGELEVKPRDVRPEDLLGRETVNIDEEEISKYLKDKRVLITGAAGSIGSGLCRHVARFSPAQIILVDHNENNLYFLIIELKSKYKDLNIKSVIGDINDIGLLKSTFSKCKPHVVFHAAAYKHVPLMEENPVAAVKNNVFGSRSIIYASHHYNVERFVLISTDKAVNPVNIMGLSKRIAEILLQAKAKRSKTKFMGVRFGNVLGSDGSVVPLFKRQIESGGPLTITHPEATRYFMSIDEAVLLVLQAGAIGKGGELFILDMGEQLKIADLAKDLVALSGLELGKDIFVEYTGLRPGEKIREELLLDKEKDRVTKYEKIYISQADNFDLVVLGKEIRELEQYVNTMSREKVIKKMKEIAFAIKEG